MQPTLPLCSYEIAFKITDNLGSKCSVSQSEIGVELGMLGKTFRLISNMYLGMFVHVFLFPHFW